MPSLLTHFFLPHASNNHRPKAIQIDVLFLYLFMLVVFRGGVSKIHALYPDVLGYATDIRVEKLFEATNQKRQEQSLSPLSLNPQLSQAAAQKAVDMFSKNYWAHNSPDGKTPWDFIVASGYSYTVAGENLAKNFSDSDGVVSAWMASPTHRDNILKSSYRDIGFAVVNGILNGEETTLVVQMFGTSVVKPVSVAAPPVVAVEGASAFSQVSKKPVINIPTMSWEISSVFLAFVMSILLLDGWLISRRKIVRIAGHNITHVVFFATVITMLSFAQRGALL